MAEILNSKVENNQDEKEEEEEKEPVNTKQNQQK